MKARFFILKLLLTLGLAGCGSQAPEQTITPEPSSDSEKSSSVVLAPPAKPAATPSLTPEPVVKVSPEPEDTKPKRDIFYSAGSGDIDAVKFHLANGIKVNSQDKTGKTALLWAVRSQKHAVVSHLLARGANPNLADKSQVTPLFWAVRMRSNELVSQLLSKGSDIGHNDKRGKTVLDYAKDETVIAILRRRASENQ